MQTNLCEKLTFKSRPHMAPQADPQRSKLTYIDSLSSRCSLEIGLLQSTQNLYQVFLVSTPFCHASKLFHSGLSEASPHYDMRISGFSAVSKVRTIEIKSSERLASNVLKNLVQKHKYQVLSLCSSTKTLVPSETEIYTSIIP